MQRCIENLAASEQSTKGIHNSERRHAQLFCIEIILELQSNVNNSEGNILNY